MPVYDDCGAFVGYRGTGRDITRAVTAEAELRAAKERAERAETRPRDAVDSIAEGFVIYDKNDQLVLCNEAYRTLYPSSVPWMTPGTAFSEILRQELLSGDCPDMVGPEKECVLERMRYHQAADYELEQKLASGRWVLVSERRMRNGGIAGLRIDITKLKQAQVALGEAERRVSDFAKTSSDWFWEQDAEFRFTSVSRA